jgi:hypothetical protein
MMSHGAVVAVVEVRPAPGAAEPIPAVAGCKIDTPEVGVTAAAAVEAGLGLSSLVGIRMMLGRLSGESTADAGLAVPAGAAVTASGWPVVAAPVRYPPDGR